MSLTVVSRPQGKGAIFNPSIYRFQRKDAGFNQVNDNGGFAQFQVNGVDLTTFFVVTNSIYVKSSTDFDDFTTVTAVAFSGGNTLVTTGLSYLAGDGGTSGDYLNNLTQRPSHKVEIEVYYASDDSLLFAVPMKYSSNSRGAIVADVASFISPVLEPNITGYDFASNFLDTGASVVYYIKYREIWTGSAEIATDDVANPLSTIYGARQVGETSNSMIDYFVTTTLGTKKFLTLMTRPRASTTYPFSVSAWLDAGTYTMKQVKYLAGSIIGTTTSSIVVSAANGVYRLDILNSASYDKILLSFLNAGTQVLTEVLTIDIVAPCKNPVTLVWMNSLGGLEQWTFDFNQEYTFTYEDGRKFKRQTMFATNLNTNQWETIDGLNTLGEVYSVSNVELSSSLFGTRKRIGQRAFVQAVAGTLTEVIVIPTQNRTFTEQVAHRMDITIEYPEMFLQR